MPATTTRVFAVRSVTAPSPTVRTAAPRFLTAAWGAFWLLTAAGEAFTELAEPADAASSAWATPAPANATPTPNVNALAPNQAYG